MPLRSLSLFILMSLLAAQLMGCGFTLRGHTPLPHALRVLHVQSHDPYGDLTKQLRQTLKTSGATLTTSASQAPITLEILGDNFSQQVSAISGSTQLVQYQFLYTVTYQVLNRNGEILISPTLVTATRHYSTNTNQMLGSSDEQNLLRQAMRRDVVAQILYRLNSTDALRALNHK